MGARFLLDVVTPLRLRVHCTHAYWTLTILEKHPVLRGREHEVHLALATPDEVRRSRSDPRVLLFYRKLGSRWMCAVVNCDAEPGFLVTAYPTDTVKIGDTVWTRSS